MYKYYDIINDNKSLILNDKNTSNYIDVSYNLPIEFFHENKKVFDELKKVFSIYGFVSDELIFNRLEGKKTKEQIYDVIYDHSLINYKRPTDDFDDKYFYVDDFYRLKHPTNYEVENYLSDMLDIIRILFKLYPDHMDYYAKLRVSVRKIHEKLKDTNKIILTDNKLKIEIPNAWYLTKDGSLYNSMGRDGHKESNLIYPLNDIKKGVYLDTFKELKERHIEEYNTIKERGYITKAQYTHYLNWYGKNACLYQDRIYHKFIVELVLGIIKAHIELYDAFDKVNETNDPSISIDKIFKLSHSQVDDLLIKYVGMSKLKAGGFPFICTSNTHLREFEEYTDRGYRIDLVNPIVVKDGEVKEIDLSDHIKILKALGR